MTTARDHASTDWPTFGQLRHRAPPSMPEDIRAAAVPEALQRVLIAAAEGDDRRLKALTDGPQGTPIDACDGLALRMLVRIGHRQGVDTLLRAGADPNCGPPGWKPLSLAAISRGHGLHYAMVLHRAGAQIDADDGSALAAACVARDAQIVRFLLSRGASVTEQNGLALDLIERDPELRLAAFDRALDPPTGGGDVNPVRANLAHRISRHRRRIAGVDSAP